MIAKHFHIVFWLAFIFPLTLLGQDTQGNDLDEKSFQRIANQVDYNETKNALRLKEFEIEEPEEKEELEFSPGWWNTLSLFKYLAYGAIIILVAYILFVLFSNIKIEKKVKSTEVIPDEEEEHIEDMDIISALDQALADGDYRLAIRLHFLEILKSLTQNGLIKWKPDKTNRDYSRELRSHKSHRDFQNLARIYEVIWYGNTSISQSEYDPIVLKFKSFMNE